MDKVALRRQLIEQRLNLPDRLGRADEAGRVLEEIIATRGPSSETNGLLGRAYKDRWDAARQAGYAAWASVANAVAQFEPVAIAVDPSQTARARRMLDSAIEVAETVPFDAASIQAGLRERIVDDLGIKPKFAFAPIRVAISGRTVSPPLFESMEILGRDESLVRLRALRGFVG